MGQAPEKTRMTFGSSTRKDGRIIVCSQGNGRHEKNIEKVCFQSPFLTHHVSVAPDAAWKRDSKVARQYPEKRGVGGGVWGSQAGGGSIITSSLLLSRAQIYSLSNPSAKTARTRGQEGEERTSPHSPFCYEKQQHPS